MPTIRTCPKCGAENTGGPLDGLCPKCVASLVLLEELAPEAVSTVQVPVSEKPGDRIGHYKLLQQIGEGGCGIVYMAQQEEPVRRQVALKIIKLGMDTKQVIARFEAERQALALMDHPNIAKVLDAGATDTGRPFFVLELVRGTKITDYCDHAKVPTRQRLDLFVQICQAVQHAHQKGVIHRDLKPSNILVTLRDGVPVPKVIDFGIAKATTDQLLTDKTVFTEFQQFLGTPAYMSPEQAEMSELGIDTRSDIYSLGILLYELLTGKTPFETKDLVRAGVEEIRRIIREKEPVRPSTRLSTMLAGELTTAARQRNAEPPALINLVRGELDWIVLQCLEKDRTRRYDSASALAADIQHHLCNEPISAGAPSRLHRLQKFVRRNKGPVAASVAILVVLVAGVIGTTLGLVGQAHQRAEAQKQALDAKAQAEEANRQAAVAEAVSRFQVDMLTRADPEKLLGDKVTVLQAMTAAVKELDEGKLKDQPLVEAQVREAIGHTLRVLGRLDAAEPNLRKALELVRRGRPAGHPEIPIALNNLAVLLTQLDRLPEAETLSRESLELRRKAPPGSEADLALGLNSLAVILKDEGKYGEAESLSRECLALQRKTLSSGHPNLAYSLTSVGQLLRTEGKPFDAEPFYREALEIRRKSLPPTHPLVANSVNSLAMVLLDQGKLTEPEPLLREGLNIRSNTLPADHWEIGEGLDNLATALIKEGKFPEAEPVCLQGLAVRRKALRAGHVDIALSLSNLGFMLHQQGRFAEAEPLLGEALEIRRKGLPAGHPFIARSLGQLGVLLLDQGRLTEAEPLLSEALKIRRQALPAMHPDIARSLIDLGKLRRSQGQLKEAETLQREALDIRKQARPKGLPWFPSAFTDLTEAFNELALTLLVENRFAAVESMSRECLTIAEKELPDDWRTFNARSLLGASLLGQTNFVEAEPLLLAGYDGMREREAKITATFRPQLKASLARLIELYDATSRPDQAAEWKKKLAELP